MREGTHVLGGKPALAPELGHIPSDGIGHGVSSCWSRTGKSGHRSCGLEPATLKDLQQRPDSTKRQPASGHSDATLADAQDACARELRAGLHDHSAAIPGINADLAYAPQKHQVRPEITPDAASIMTIASDCNWPYGADQDRSAAKA
jgi:hypothetical protein